MADPRLEAEVVVVGSGPGGAITAALLAEAGRDVLVVEEGPELSQDSCPAYTRRELEQKYRGGGAGVALGAVPVAYVEGRCVGGGSEITSCLYHRPPPAMLDGWRRTHGVEGLTAAALAPCVEAGERELGVTARPGSPPPASERLRQGAAALGWSSVDVPRFFDYAAAGGGEGRRRSMTETFVPRLRAAGGRLVADTRVVRLRRRGGDWWLDAVQGATVRALRARTVFLAAGTIHTPAILRRSGITHAVGEALGCHPMVRALARFPDAVNGPGAAMATAQVKEFAPRFSLGCSVSTPPYLALALAEHRDRLDGLEADWPRMAVYYAMTSGGRGRVRPLPGFRDPLVRYRLDTGDLAELGDALRALCRALLAAGAVEVYPGVAGLGPLRTEADVVRIPAALPPGRTSVVTLHLFGACPMGEERARCAVDSTGAVHGQTGLHVADASLLCGAPGVNPQGTIMALVRRNALAFLDRAASPAWGSARGKGIVAP